MQAVTAIEFGKQIQNYAGYVVDSKKLITGIDGKARQHTGWRNLRLKSIENGIEDIGLEEEWKNYEG